MAGSARRLPSWVVVGAAITLLGLRTSVSLARGGSQADWIAYVRHGDVYVIDPQTGAVRRLTNGGAVHWIIGIAGGVAVSPDETEVAYTVPAHRSNTSSPARTIMVQSIGGGRARNVTPWNSVGWSGHGRQAQPTHIDPHWVDATQLDYTDDLGSNGQAYGVAMTVNLATGRHGRAVVPPSAHRFTRCSTGEATAARRPSTSRAAPESKR